MKPIEHENAVFKYAAGFLPKHKVDTVAQFADKHDLYAMKYDAINDEWIFHDGELFSTQTIIISCIETGLIL